VDRKLGHSVTVAGPDRLPIDVSRRSPFQVMIAPPSMLSVLNRGTLASSERVPKQEEAFMVILQRRDFLVGAGAVGASLFASGLPSAFGAEAERVVPWLDQPEPIPPPAQGIIKDLTPWQDLTSWITPKDKFFAIGHYNWPEIDPNSWKLTISGLVENPRTLTLADLKARPRKETAFTIECSGNNGLPFFTSAIGNAKWAGAQLSEILDAAKPTSDAIEVVFFGTDQGDEVLRAGTPGEFKFKGTFARSMSIEDAMNPANMLCYEMNGEPLPARHGAPVRLIVPGWFGIANVKWLSRIEVRDRRFMNRFMGRDYVTVRETKSDNNDVEITETSVGRQLLKSAPARVTATGDRYQIEGMAWGPNPIRSVEVQIDNDPWQPATLAEHDESPFAWQFWTYDWKDPARGKHAVTSRATDMKGNVQPAMNDPMIAGKKTYWESNGQITRKVDIT
jgi:DMSO/TMAO reductase YedYZ molybdopterin-dependent catalytic subunit